MAIKKLQNNFTTPEQSKRLLKLGVPADSADCHYTKMQTMIWTNGNRDMDFTCGTIIPCWSVGRLIEIYELLMGIPFTRYNLKISLLTEVLERYWQNNKQLDFSKLED